MKLTFPIEDRRVVALLIDVIISFVLTYPTMLLIKPHLSPFEWGDNYSIAFLLVLMCVFMSYSLATTAIWHRTLGKFIMQIKVICMTGAQVRIWQLLLREIFRYVFLWIGILAFLSYFKIKGGKNTDYDAWFKTTVKANN